MSFAPNDVQCIGSFREKEFGNLFEVSENPEITLAPPAHGGKNMVYPHRIWVTTPIPGIDSGWRYAKVMKTCAHVITDDGDDGMAVVQKWDIRSVRKYGFGTAKFPF